jgi:hypothetical protein
MYARISALLVAVGAVVAMNGCGDPTNIRADFDNIDTSRTVFAFNGTPATLPAAILVRGVAPVRLDAAFNFDLAFDINDADEVVAYSPRKIASDVASTHRVGVQFTDRAFAEVTEAPKSGYLFDSIYVLPVGRVFIIDVLDPSCSQFSILGPNIKAKAVVDSVNLTVRAVFVHMLANPNCGFLNLQPGTPPPP